jgi:hypothetical protein
MTAPHGRPTLPPARAGKHVRIHPRRIQGKTRFNYRTQCDADSNSERCVLRNFVRRRISGQATVKERTMNKVMIALMAIYFLGDPGLQYLAWLGELKLYLVAAAIALVSMPWIASQIDG